MDNEARRNRLLFEAFCAGVVGLFLLLLLATACFGVLPRYAFTPDVVGSVRFWLILIIRSLAIALTVGGVLHAGISWRGVSNYSEPLEKQLQALTEASASPDLVYEVAYRRDNDFLLMLMYWGARSLLLLGLLGTVWGLSLAVSPIADAVADASVGIGDATVTQADPTAAAPAGGHRSKSFWRKPAKP